MGSSRSAKPCTHAHVLMGGWSQQGPDILSVCHPFSLLSPAARGPPTELGIWALGQGTVRLPLREVELQPGLGVVGESLGVAARVTTGQGPCYACR